MILIQGKVMNCTEYQLNAFHGNQIVLKIECHVDLDVTLY